MLSSKKKYLFEESRVTEDIFQNCHDFFDVLVEYQNTIQASEDDAANNTNALNKTTLIGKVVVEESE
jgi:hypothetical protein